MSPEALISRVYAHFRSTGTWPKVRPLQVELRAHGNLRLIAAKAGRERVVCDDSHDGVCRLTLKCLSELPAAQDDVSHYLAAIRLMASHFITKGAVEISTEEIGTALSLDAAGLKRLVALLWRDAIWFSTSSGYEDSMRGIPVDDILFFEAVDSLGEIEEVRARLDAERAEVAQLHWGAGQRIAQLPHQEQDWPKALLPFLPQALSVQHPGLQAASLVDLRELSLAISAGAWKSAAILAGSCLEALLLDLWMQREEAATAKWSERWPKRVQLSELVKAAAEGGLISATHKDLASVMRSARNLVHPMSASAEPSVTPSQLSVLLGALSMINTELSRAAS